MKDLLVYVDTAAIHPRAAEIATQLADALAAHITALFVPQGEASPIVLDAGGPFLDAGLSKSAHDVAKSLKKKVESITSTNVAGFSWMEENASGAGEALIKYGKVSDLILVTFGNDRNCLSTRAIARVASESARPILAVPERHVTGRCGSRVIVGWNGSPGVVRALHASLPILRSAEQVEIVIVMASAASPGRGEVAGGLRQHLRRHGIDASVKLLKDDPVKGVDGLLLERAREIGADLIVTGAFGRSRLRELALGSVTESIMTATAIPVLLSD